MTAAPKPTPRRQNKAGGIRARNAKRRAAEFARAFHSEERVRFVRSQPCAACLKFGEIENAHIEGGGASRRADYTKIVPLCRTCHRQMHRMGLDTFLARHGLDRAEIAAIAEHTERSWKARQTSVPFAADAPWGSWRQSSESGQ